MRIGYDALLGAVALAARHKQRSTCNGDRSMNTFIQPDYKPVSMIESPGVIRTYYLRKDRSLVACHESHDGNVGHFGCSQLVQPYRK
jgi:hypothetical protein